MNLKSLLGASILALSVSGAAQADEIIHVTGSTAFRKVAVLALENFFSASYKGAYVPISSGTGETQANYMIIQGVAGGVTYTFKCTWTGSIGGMIVNTTQDDIRNVPTNGWLSETNLPASGMVAVSAGSASYLLDGEAQGYAADVNFSDSSQADTGYTTPALNAAGLSNSGTGQVGILAFDWIFGNSNTTNGTAATPPPVTNITSHEVRALLTGGAFLSMLTGNSADYNPTSTGKVCYMVGRNFDSGTRQSEFAESRFGFNSLPQQMVVAVANATGGAATLGDAGSHITNISLYPAEVLYSGQPYQLSFGKGQSGYASGSSVAQALASPGALGSPATSNPVRPIFQKLYSINGGYLIGYLGQSDAATAIGTSVDAANTAFKLNFDGVSDTMANIVEGLYHAWEIEYIYYTPRTTNPLDSNQIAAINSVADYIYSSGASNGGILLSAMHVSRLLDGGAITHK